MLSILIFINPFSVNLSEFEIRFTKTCLIRLESECISWLRTIWSHLIRNFSFLSVHWNSYIYLISLRISFNVNLLMFRENVWVVNFAKSRISSTKIKSNFEETSLILKKFLNLLEWYLRSFENTMFAKFWLQLVDSDTGKMMRVYYCIQRSSKFVWYTCKHQSLTFAICSLFFKFI